MQIGIDLAHVRLVLKKGGRKLEGQPISVPLKPGVKGRGSCKPSRSQLDRWQSQCFELPELLQRDTITQENQHHQCRCYSLTAV